MISLRDGFKGLSTCSRNVHRTSHGAGRWTIYEVSKTWQTIARDDGLLFAKECTPRITQVKYRLSDARVMTLPGLVVAGVTRYVSLFVSSVVTVCKHFLYSGWRITPFHFFYSCMYIQRKVQYCLAVWLRMGIDLLGVFYLKWHSKLTHEVLFVHTKLQHSVWMNALTTVKKL